MKPFARNTILREIHSPSSPDTNPNSSMKQQQREQLRSTPTKRQIFSDQNKPPPPSPDSAVVGKMKSPLPPRPPNPNKRRLLDAVAHENLVSGTDSGVQVVVRMRPPNKDEGEGEMMVKQTSTDSLSVNGQMFTFDSVADTQATQLELFQLVGVPLVENCLAGFNSSVFAYGQTGSGKTYTIWGPANALSEEKHSSDQQGLTPRVFDRLFSRIKEEQIKHADKQVKYQCRCSFLEIYNEQITDLLDPSQGSLQIREDVKSGVYVENLTEECVFTMKDVTRLLIKGLSNRKTGATSINSESSRSHSVFTCVVESRCKSKSDGISSLRTSRINLVDLAGSERQKLTGAAGDRLKEAGNINRSLSQLGNLINILAEVSKTGKQRHIPYRDSRLTFLLQESLGGNGKLAMVCAISPSQSCKSETLSTLRFAQRAKSIKNKAIVNEVLQDDVNVLREVIRELKDELLRMKANGVSTDPSGSYSTGWNARRSLNLLRFSLNHPMALTHVDYDSDAEMEILEESGMEFSQLNSDTVASIEEIIGKAEANLTGSEPLNNKIPNDTDVVMQDGLAEAVKHENRTKDQDFSNANVGSHSNQLEGNVEEDHVNSTVGVTDGDLETPSKYVISTVGEISVVDVSNYSPPGSIISAFSSNLTIVPCDVSTVKSSIQSASPKVSSSRKSLRSSEIITASRTDLKDEGEFGPDYLVAKSIKSSISNALAMRASKNFNAPTEQLAASLHRGLEIMDCHRQSSVLRRSAFRFSLKPVEYRPMSVLDRVSVGVQTLPRDNDILEDDSVVVLCSNCKTRTLQAEEKEDEDSSNLQLVPIEGSVSSDRLKNQVPKAVEKVLAGAIRREMALEEICSKQTAEIKQLNRVVQQYKHERDCNAIIGQIRDDKIVRLERLMDGVLPTAEFMEEEFCSLTNEYKILKDKYENHPEILRTKVQLKRVQDQLELYRSFHDLGERDVLLEEVQDLRSQLQYYTDSSALSARKRNPPSQLIHSSEPSLTTPPLCTIPESNEGTILEKFEQERLRWTEAERKWISLSEELRIELDASRSLADKQKQELDSEKKCAEELKEAMQMAMEGHARMLEQYADLQENHFSLLARHRKIQDGIDDVKKAAVKAGVKGAESRFINPLAAEISALKAQREKETRHLRDENKELQVQLRDTAEAVQAAGELLVRLKEAEEAVAAAQDRAIMAEHEAASTFKQMNKLKRKYENEISDLNERFSEYPLQKTTFRSAYGEDSDKRKYDVEESPSVGDQQLAEPSWFSGYDRCNI